MSRMSSTSSPLPPAPEQSFQEYLRAGELRLQFCTDCAKHFFYPRTLCPTCGGRALEWRRVSGAGIVYSTTIIRQRPERGGDYNVSIIELGEGVRMMSALRDVAPGDVKIGLKVSALLVEEEGRMAVFFVPAPSGPLAPGNTP
jgi:uncharacterized OB-fold protein